MNDPWVARRDLDGSLYYVEIVPPSGRDKLETRARISRIVRGLLIPGIAVNALILVPGIGACVVMKAYTLTVVLIMFSAAFWFGAGHGWKAFVRRIEARPKKIRRSVAACRRHREKVRAHQANSAPRTRIQGGLEVPA